MENLRSKVGMSVSALLALALVVTWIFLLKQNQEIHKLRADVSSLMLDRIINPNAPPPVMTIPEFYYRQDPSKRVDVAKALFPYSGEVSLNLTKHCPDDDSVVFGIYNAGNTTTISVD